MDFHYRVMFAEGVTNNVAEEIVATDWKVTPDGNFAQFIQVTTDENGQPIEKIVRAYNLNHVLTITPLEAVKLLPAVDTLPMIEDVPQQAPRTIQGYTIRPRGLVDQLTPEQIAVMLRRELEADRVMPQGLYVPQMPDNEPF